MKISVIIPIFNEEKTVAECLQSLQKQTIPHELIVIDDGSTDKTINILSEFQISNFKFQIIKQSHLGPGAARNSGARVSTGDILVFVDSDMTFAPDFLEVLTLQIEKGESKGTFTKAETVKNWENVWSRCWNFNLGLTGRSRLPGNYPDSAPVFRAVLKSEFVRVNGFTAGLGWTDDWSLSEKLGYKSTATKALCFHHNPDSLGEVFLQSRWIGKNRFFSNNVFKLLLNLFRFSPFGSVVIGFFKSIMYKEPRFLLFKYVYDFGIFNGLILSFLGAHKNK